MLRSKNELIRLIWKNRRGKRAFYKMSIAKNIFYTLKAIMCVKLDRKLNQSTLPFYDVVILGFKPHNIFGRNGKVCSSRMEYYGIGVLRGIIKNWYVVFYSEFDDDDIETGGINSSFEIRKHE